MCNAIEWNHLKPLKSFCGAVAFDRDALFNCLLLSEFISKYQMMMMTMMMMMMMIIIIITMINVSCYLAYTVVN